MPLHPRNKSTKKLSGLPAIVSAGLLSVGLSVSSAQAQSYSNYSGYVVPTINESPTPLRDKAGQAVGAAVNALKPNMMDMPVSALPSIADLVDEVSPSVVNIIVTTATGETTSEGQGSGFVISNLNEVVTNYHVIDGGTNIDIEFNDGRRYPARVLGTDEETDLALLQIKTRERIPFVSFQKNDDLRIGDWVVAIGNPFGIGQSTSLGVISAIGRERVESGSYVDYIQTDATINRGNSGGPLFNLDGEVVGVNSAIYSPTGASVGIAFVIPHHTAAEVVKDLRAHGRVKRGFLGAGLRDAEFSREGEPTAFKVGALVNAIVPGSPAERYGLRIDDIILQVNGVEVENSVDATRQIGKLKPGQTAKLIFERDEEPYLVNVSIGERPDKHGVDTARAESQGLPPPEPKRTGPPINVDTGLQVLDISAEFRTAIKMRSDQVGIYVESVTPGSGAERGGFKSGMVLLEADGTPLAQTDVLRTVVLNAKLAEKTRMRVRVRLANGRETQMTLPL